MRSLDKTSQFKRDLKTVSKSGKYDFDGIQEVIDLLANDSPLPERFRDHALAGKWKRIRARECHVYPDLLLVYAKIPGQLVLLRLASHSELF